MAQGQAQLEIIDYGGGASFCVFLSYHWWACFSNVLSLKESPWNNHSSSTGVLLARWFGSSYRGYSIVCSIVSLSLLNILSISTLNSILESLYLWLVLIVSSEFQSSLKGGRVFVLFYHVSFCSLMMFLSYVTVSLSHSQGRFRMFMCLRDYLVA